jgi:hypothetical protein
MKAKSAIEKGKRAEKCACERIERAGLGESCRTPGSGSGKKKGDLFNNLPFMFEVKNWDNLHIQEWVRQAKRQAEQGNFDSNKWAVVMVNPDGAQDIERMELWFLCEFDEALELMKRSAEPKVKQPDKELKWRLELLSEYLKHLEKEPKYYYSKVKKICNEIIKRI